MARRGQPFIAAAEAATRAPSLVPRELARRAPRPPQMMYRRSGESIRRAERSGPGFDRDGDSPKVMLRPGTFHAAHPKIWDGHARRNASVEASGGVRLGTMRTRLLGNARAGTQRSDAQPSRP